jgi:hypothetical protein
MQSNPLREAGRRRIDGRLDAAANGSHQRPATARAANRGTRGLASSRAPKRGAPPKQIAPRKCPNPAPLRLLASSRNRIKLNILTSSGQAIDPFHLQPAIAPNAKYAELGTLLDIARSRVRRPRRSLALLWGTGLGAKLITAFCTRTRQALVRHSASLVSCETTQLHALRLQRAQSLLAGLLKVQPAMQHRHSRPRWG